MLFAYRQVLDKYRPVKVFGKLPTQAETGKEYPGYEQVRELSGEDKKLSLEELQRKYPYRADSTETK